MSATTPGPWWADGIEVLNDPIGSVKVAKVSGANHGEAKANARLIARAPEMRDLLLKLELEPMADGSGRRSCSQCAIIEGHARDCPFEVVLKGLR